MDDLNVLYDYIIDNNSLDLTNSNFDNEILVKENIVKRSENKYIFNEIKGLFTYGKYLLNKKDYKRAEVCFNLCYEIDPKDISVCFQNFYGRVRDAKFDESFKYFDTLYKEVEDKNIKRDLLYYLYLLSLVTEVPKKYSKLLNNIRFQDIKINPSARNYNNIELRNDIRYNILGKKIVYCIYKLDEVINNSDKILLNDLIVKTILFRAKKIERKRIKRIIKLIQTKSYREILDILNSGKKLKIDKYIIKVINNIIEIDRTGIIPDVDKSKKPKNVYECIDCNDYLNALDKCLKAGERANLDKSNNILYLLLRDINNKIDSVKKENNELMKVIELFLNKNVLKGIKELEIYLSKIGRLDYRDLLIDLIKIGILDKDNNFKKFIEEVYLLKNVDYKFNSEKFKKCFYESLKVRKISTSQVYLNILNKYGNDVEKENIIFNTLTNDNFKLNSNTIKIREKLNSNGIILIEKESIDILEIYKLMGLDNTIKVIETDYKDKGYILLSHVISDDTNEYKEIISEARKYYYKDDLEKSLEFYLKSITYSNGDKPKVYARIGIIYYKLGNYESAIEYLMIANIISKLKGLENDYSKIIQGINKIKTDYRNSDFGITNFSRINRFIESMNFDVETACGYFNLEGEKVQLVKLLYAREYYYEGDINTGDKFLNSVKKDSNKSERVKYILNKLQENKKFLSNNKSNKISVLHIIARPSKN